MSTVGVAAGGDAAAAEPAGGLWPAGWVGERRAVAGVSLELVRGGSGRPLLVFHDEVAHPGSLGFLEDLAAGFRVHLPFHPGFGRTERVDWVMNMRDLAGWYLLALEDLGLDGVDAVGFSLGGWLAAELATMRPETFRRLVLVAPMGVRPPEGFIYDMFLQVARQFIRDGFYDPEAVPEFGVVCPEAPAAELAQGWEVAREEACRLGWRPYMYYPGLPPLLARLRGLPTLLVWGREDGIVPVSAGQVYQQAIPGSRLAVLEGCGHYPQLERREEFVGLVREFLG